MLNIYTEASTEVGFTCSLDHKEPMYVEYIHRSGLHMSTGPQRNQCMLYIYTEAFTEVGFTCPLDLKEPMYVVYIHRSGLHMSTEPQRNQCMLYIYTEASTEVHKRHRGSAQSNVILTYCFGSCNLSSFIPIILEYC